MEYINKEKLLKINLNKNNICYIIDFDRTLTKENCEDSWDAVANKKIFGEELSKELNNLYKKYGPIEVNYKIPFEEKEKYMIEWYQKCMETYYRFNLTKVKVENSIKTSSIELRPGVIEFLNFNKEENIPIIILSAGIGNTIEEVLKQNSCYFENIHIISNFIKFDNEGYILKYEGDLIHSLNKNIDKINQKEIIDIVESKEYRIVIGDLIEDIKMAGDYPDDKLIKIGFLNQNVNENLEKYKERFDIVLTKESQDFNEVSKIVKLSIMLINLKSYNFFIKK